jgi:hypothetical protein
VKEKLFCKFCAGVFSIEFHDFDHFLIGWGFFMTQSLERVRKRG